VNNEDPNQDWSWSETLKKFIAVLAVLAVLVLVGFAAWYFTSSQATYSGKPESITVGGPALEQSALIYIAQDQGFFSKNGLNVTIRDDYPTGVGPVRDMVSGKLNVSVSAEYPVIARSSTGKISASSGPSTNTRTRRS
jgi:ABC-type nitrate/sulfonate/bicarbonate transport system substrate-binding protein